MMILEIIELRTAERDKVILELEHIMPEWIMPSTLFINTTVSTDLSIHLRYHREQSGSETQLPGAQIKDYLNKWGLVHHSVWQDASSSGGTNE